MKKLLLSVAILAIIMPAMAMAGGYRSPDTDELLKKIEDLSRELATMKQELATVKKERAYATKAQLEALKEEQEETADTLEELSENFDTLMTDGVGRFEFFGDYRFRLDSTRVRTNSYQAMFMDPATGMPVSMKMRNEDIENDTLYTNRLRLGMKVKASDNLTFKGRLTMYKIWGMESASKTSSGLFPMNGFSYDPNISRRPNDNTLRVEMAYVNWTNIAGMPVWFSIGRRPTVDGPPAQLRYNYDSRYATPIALGIDWTFDGLTLGYAGDALMLPGAKFRICYGRGYESGLDYSGNGSGDLADTDLYGFSWDIINDREAHRFANLQFFRAASIPNMMEGTMYMAPDMMLNQSAFNPMAVQMMSPLMDTEMAVMVDANKQVGDIYQGSVVYMDEFRGVNWFVSAALSRTDDRGTKNGIHQSFGLLTNPGESKENHWGWAAYAGARVPVDMLRSKIGFEYNYGSRYWISFTPAADDVYSSKLATRGHVAELYWIWDLPETPLSKYAKAFVRAGYQYYWFNYTGSGNWMGKPIDVDKVDMNMMDPSNWDYATAFGAAPIDHMDNLYLTFEIFF
jgi:hypothetical protein